MQSTGRTRRAALLVLALAVASPAAAQPAVQRKVEARLAEAGPGPRFGLVVTDEAGRELVAINPDQRFIPASNTKIFTTAAAFTCSAMSTVRISPAEPRSGWRAGAFRTWC
jgi:D-alanyl-D-alanine carboxypeptidase